SGLYPYRRASATSSCAFATTTLRCGPVPVTDTPRPRRNSTSPSSRSVRSARNTVLALTPSTAARSRAGGSRSPATASPSAIARRIAAATCSCSGTGLEWSIPTVGLVLLTLALYQTSRTHRQKTKNGPQRQAPPAIAVNPPPRTTVITALSGPVLPTDDRR